MTVSSEFQPGFPHLTKFLADKPSTSEHEYDEEYWDAVDRGEVYVPGEGDEEEDEEPPAPRHQVKSLMEVKKRVIRRVRTREGALAYGLQIGDIITLDAIERAKREKGEDPEAPGKKPKAKDDEKKPVPAAKPVPVPPKYVAAVASLLHEEWRAARKKDDGSFEPRMKPDGNGGEVDIANTPYKDLPEKWQKDNRDAAEGALRAAMTMEVLDLEALSEEVHKQWLSRNSEWASDVQKLPYADLPEDEKEKDRVVARLALNMLAGPEARNAARGKARDRVDAATLDAPKTVKVPKGYHSDSDNDRMPSVARRLATGHRLEIRSSTRNLKGDLDWEWRIFDPSTRGGYAPGKLGLTVGDERSGKAKTFEEAVAAAEAEVKVYESRVSAKRKKAHVRKKIEGGFLDNWFGVRGWDWEDEEGESADVDWDDDRSRLRFAKKEADRLGVQIAGSAGADYVETILAMMSSYEEMFPGLTSYQRTIAFKRSLGGATAYNTPRRAWGRNSDQDHGFSPNDDNPGMMGGGLPGSRIGSWDEVSMAFSTSHYGNGEHDAYTISSQARSSERSSWFSTRTHLVAEHMGIEPWQADFIVTANHEIGHTFARIAFGHLGGAVEDEATRRDRRARFHKGMADIFEKYDIRFTDPGADQFAGTGNHNLDRDRIIGVDKKDIGQVLSVYGATNLHEVMAEAWAEYMTDPEPRAFARDIGDMLWGMMDEFLDNEGAR